MTLFSVPVGDGSVNVDLFGLPERVLRGCDALFCAEGSSQHLPSFSVGSDSGRSLSALERWRIDRGQKTILIQPDARLIDVEIAVRQGISLWCSHELEHWHSATIRINEVNGPVIAILGASGSGKSSAIARVLRAWPNSEVVEEDWGPIDHRAGHSLAGYRKRTLLKRHSAPEIAVAVGDMIAQDPTDPSRAIYEASETERRWVKLHCLLILGATGGPPFRPFVAEDANWIAAGVDSAFYGSAEVWLDGSTLHFDATENSRRKMRLLTLASRVSSFAVREGEAELAVISAAKMLLGRIGRP